MGTNDSASEGDVRRTSGWLSAQRAERWRVIIFPVWLLRLPPFPAPYRISVVYGSGVPQLDSKSVASIRAAAAAAAGAGGDDELSRWSFDADEAC